MSESVALSPKVEEDSLRLKKKTSKDNSVLKSMKITREFDPETSLLTAEQSFIGAQKGLDNEKFKDYVSYRNS